MRYCRRLQFPFAIDVTPLFNINAPRDQTIPITSINRSQIPQQLRDFFSQRGLSVDLEVGEASCSGILNIPPQTYFPAHIDCNLFGDNPVHLNFVYNGDESETVWYRKINSDDPKLDSDPSNHLRYLPGLVEIHRQNTSGWHLFNASTWHGVENFTEMRRWCFNLVVVDCRGSKPKNINWHEAQEILKDIIVD